MEIWDNEEASRPFWEGEHGEEIAQYHVGDWRWGTIERFVYEVDGKLFAMDVRMQPEHGAQICSAPFEVEKKERTILEYVKK